MYIYISKVSIYTKAYFDASSGHFPSLWLCNKGLLTILSRTGYLYH